MHTVQKVICACVPPLPRCTLAHTYLYTQCSHSVSSGQESSCEAPCKLPVITAVSQNSVEEREGEEKRGRQKGKAINKFWAERRRYWLSNPFLFIRLWFVFWLGGAAMRMGGIKGICWWMKFLRRLYMKGRIKGYAINKPICFLAKEWNLKRKISMLILFLVECQMRRLMPLSYPSVGIWSYMPAAG